jgi:integrase
MAYVRDKARVLAPGTAERYGRNLVIFLRWLKQREGGKRKLYPDILTRNLLAEFYEHLAIKGRHGRPRQDSTRRKIVEVVQLAWEWAYNDDELAEGVPSPRSIEMRRKEGAPTVAPTWTEMDAVIHAFPEGSWQRQLAIVLRFTGLRVQQALGLRWDDVDMDEATLTIRGELGKSRQERRGRIVPLSPHLMSILAGWGKREGYLIPTNRQARRERLARPRDLGRAWDRAGVRKGAWEGRPHHAFRKGFVSELRRAGADPDVVEVLVGHSLGLRGVYTDPDALPMREAVALIPPIQESRVVLRLEPKEVKK